MSLEFYSSKVRMEYLLMQAEAMGFSQSAVNAASRGDSSLASNLLSCARSEIKHFAEGIPSMKGGERSWATGAVEGIDRYVSVRERKVNKLDGGYEQ